MSTYKYLYVFYPLRDVICKNEFNLTYMTVCKFSCIASLSWRDLKPSWIWHQSLLLRCFCAFQEDFRAMFQEPLFHSILPMTLLPWFKDKLIWCSVQRNKISLRIGWNPWEFLQYLFSDWWYLQHWTNFMLLLGTCSIFMVVKDTWVKLLTLLLGIVQSFNWISLNNVVRT